MAFLKRPDSYIPPATRVETRETHLSWVFLTDEHAYKLKKPLNLGYVDYSTLPNRMHMCEEEVRLNQFLAPGVYLDTTPVVKEAGGALQIDRGGLVIEWLVVMRRLPDDLMLDRVFADRKATEVHANRIGKTLAEFYRSRAVIAMPLAGYLESLETEMKIDEDELARPEFGQSADILYDVLSAQRRTITESSWLFEERAGSIVEAHGDLRPEHICLAAKPLIIDRLEFDRKLRILDAASELAFFWLECERLGDARFGRLVFEQYCKVARDYPGRRLIEFYRRWHACIRARLAVWHLRDGPVADPEKWRAKGEQYLRLALTPLEGPAFWMDG